MISTLLEKLTVAVLYAIDYLGLSELCGYSIDEEDGE